MGRLLDLTYLGVAGWHFRTESTSLLFDPYFTRMGLIRGEIGPAIPATDLIAQHTPPADAILISHPHFDHIMDAPEASRVTGAPIYTSPQGATLMRILGVPDSRICAARPGDVLRIGDFTVTIHRAQHRIIFGTVPFYGALRPNLKPPIHGRDYRMDQLFSFLVEVDDLRVLVTSGIDCEPAIRADVLLVGGDASRDQLALILEDVRPRLVLPNHWDNMFQPLTAPIRPMVQSPRRFTLWPRRIDLKAFTRHVSELAPAARVIIPDRFRAYPVRLTLSESE